MRDVAAGLQVDAGRMRANLDLTHGLIMGEAVKMALGAASRAHAAHKLVEQASQQAAASGRHLREVLGGDAEVSRASVTERLERLFDPANYLGEAGAFIDRVLAATEQQRSDSTGEKRMMPISTTMARGSITELEGRDDAPVLVLSNSLGTDAGPCGRRRCRRSLQHFRVLRHDTRGHGRSAVHARPVLASRSWAATCWRCWTISASRAPISAACRWAA